MSRLIYPFDSLTALAAQDGTNLKDGDRARVFSLGAEYPYQLDEDSGATENSPYIIAPATNAGTKRWILQGQPYLDPNGDTVFHSNLVRSLDRLAWNYGVEGFFGVGYILSPTANPRFAGYGFSNSAAWTKIGYAGAVSQVVSDDVYVTVLDIITSGSGVITNIILPGFTNVGDTVTLKVTLDGNELTEKSFTTVNAAYRFASGFIEHVSTYGYGTSSAVWPGVANIGNQAVNAPTGSDGAYATLASPTRQLGATPCLRFMDSIKIEMKASDVSTTNYRDYCGVAYFLDQS